MPLVLLTDIVRHFIANDNRATESEEAIKLFKNQEAIALRRLNKYCADARFRVVNRRKCKVGKREVLKPALAVLLKPKVGGSGVNLVLWKDQAANEASPFYNLIRHFELDPVNKQLAGRIIVSISFRACFSS